MTENKPRPSGRAPAEMRPVSLDTSVPSAAEGACIASFGETRVLCTASLELRVPPWRRGSGLGWITAEYGMLPRATHERTRRESVAGAQSGRTKEIQRLIGRSLRAVVDMAALGERQIILDCDVLSADGGTRTAAITGAWVALHQCCALMQKRGMLERAPLRDHVAAVSCGIWEGLPVCDLDYAEDSKAEVDANIVMTGGAQFVEAQMSAERAVFSDTQLAALIALARDAIAALIDAQKKAIA